MIDFIKLKEILANAFIAGASIEHEDMREDCDEAAKDYVEQMTRDFVNII